MSALMTASEMRDLETAAIESGVLGTPVTGLELMERAGRAVVDAVFETWPELAQSSYHGVVLAGPGNNGGDGYVVARMLRDWGWDVAVYALGNPDHLPADAQANCDRWRAMGGAVRPLTDEVLEGYKTRQGGCALVIDALFGTGLTRGFETHGQIQDTLNYWAAASPTADVPKVVSVDIPSGYSADTGAYVGADDGVNSLDFAIAANLTVSFETAKLGHYLGAAPQAVGKLVVKPIGLAPLLNDWLKTRDDFSPVTLVKPDLRMRHVLDKASGHKFSHGHGLVLSGPAGKTGAARMAARAALRIGAGVVTLAAPQEAMAECAAQVTAVMLTPMEDAQALTAILADTRITALCLGPALGLTEAKADLVEAALQSKRCVVLDADALTLLAQNRARLWPLLHSNVVLTPHEGEFARLFPDLAAALRMNDIDKATATRKAAQAAGCTVLLKGPATLIASADGQTALNGALYDQAMPWLATAGAGDVLAGLITGLLARGIAAHDAAAYGAYLHLTAAHLKGVGLIAEDLPDMVPAVLAQLGL
ncbi:MAG: NAD(P)H-hydrate dehydratase [Halocynthiibacter sp.]